MRAPLLHEQFEDLDKQAHAARLGMWVFLATELLFFAGLFTLYSAYRTMYPVDFGQGVAHNNTAIGTINTAILLTSSLTVALALHEVRRGRPLWAGGLVLFSVACGLAFLILKGIEYFQHFDDGIFPAGHYHFAELYTYGAKMFFTLYFLMTGLHGIHVIVGMALLFWIANGCFRREYSSANHVHVEVVALYWHLIDIIWIFLWPMFYLMR